MSDTSLERIEKPPTKARGLHLMAFIATPEQRDLCTCQEDKRPEYHTSDCPTVLAAKSRAEGAPPVEKRKPDNGYRIFIGLSLLTAIAVLAGIMCWGGA